MTVDWYQVYTKNLIVNAAETAQLLLTGNSLSILAGLPPVNVDTDGPGLGIFRRTSPASSVVLASASLVVPNGIVQEIDSATDERW
jgi:hypothetical protein